MKFNDFLNQCAADCVEAAQPPAAMSKLEHQLRLSLVDTHIAKANDFLRRSKIAINPSLALVLAQHADEHVKDAERLRDELQQANEIEKVLNANA